MYCAAASRVRPDFLLIVCCSSCSRVLCVQPHLPMDLSKFNGAKGTPRFDPQSSVETGVRVAFHVIQALQFVLLEVAKNFYAAAGTEARFFPLWAPRDQDDAK